MSSAKTPPRKPAADGEHPKFWRWKAGELIGNRWYVHRALPPSRMSLVYFCLDIEMARPMVVKTLHPGLLRDTAAAGRFVDECELWVRLGPPPHNLPAVFVSRLYVHPLLCVEWGPWERLSRCPLESWVGTRAPTAHPAVCLA